MKVVVNKFAHRHTPQSSRSHFKGSFEDVARLAEKHFENQKPGYRDGVITVLVPPDGFFAGIVELEEGDKLVGEFKPRREGETPRKHVEAACHSFLDPIGLGFERFDGIGKFRKMPAVSVELGLYASAVLAEDGDNDLKPTDGNWEIVTINASPIDGEQPIEPMVLLANHFDLDGGTKTKLSDSKLVALLAVSVPFWANKTNASSTGD